MAVVALSRTPSVVGLRVPRPVNWRRQGDVCTVPCLSRPVSGCSVLSGTSFGRE
jgi:hypothetical protein